MRTTTFFKKDGNVSSREHTLNVGRNSISFSEHIGGGGGVTFRSGRMTTRFNSNHQCISHGLTTGSHTTYVGGNLKSISQISSF